MNGSGSTSAFILALNSWPVILSVMVGVIATHLTEILTHRRAPQWVKSGVNAFLSALGAALITIQVVPGHTWKDYVGLIVMAMVSSLVTHKTGVTAWAQSLFGGVGIGANAKPLVTPDATNDSADPSTTVVVGGDAPATNDQAGEFQPDGPPVPKG